MSTIIGISYERMDESKSKLSRARGVAQEEKNKLIEAATVLGATRSQELRCEADVINDMIRKEKWTLKWTILKELWQALIIQ